MTTTFNLNSHIIEESINKFFEEHNIDPANTLIPELSRYIVLTNNHKENTPRLENIIKAYDQSLGRLDSKLEEHKEEFFSLMNKLVEGHKHQERFIKINENHAPKKETPEEAIINTLKGLLEEHTIINALKQSSHDKEFKEKITDIVTTYNSQLNSNIAQQHKVNPLPIIKAKLTELDKWCEEIAKKDNSQIFKNIGKVIKHSLNAVISLITGDKEAFKKEIDNTRIYMDGIKNANKNTLEATKKVRNFVEKCISSKNQSQTNQIGI